MTYETCQDNRFEVIENAKKRLMEATNIEDSEREMEVVDSFLFRCWQMGWLDGFITCTNDSLKPDQFICSLCHAHYDIARLDVPEDEDTGIPNVCPNCGTKVVI